MSSAALTESYAAWQVMDYQSETGLLSAHLLGSFPWLYTVSPFAEIDICVVDGDRHFSLRMSFWLWLRALATWRDLLQLTCRMYGCAKPVAKPKPRSHRVKHTPELKREPRPLTSTAEPCPAGNQDGIVSGKVDADSVKRQSAAHEIPELFLDSPLMSEDAMRGLIDDWLVPAVVDRLIRCLSADPPTGTKG